MYGYCSHTTTHSKMATNDQFQTSVIAELQALRKEIAELKGTQASSKPAPKSSTKTPANPRRPREPTSWDGFRGKVQAALAEGGLTANAMSYASHLKTAFGDEAYALGNEAIIAAFSDYTPPEPKPRKPKAKAGEASEGEEAKPRAKSTYKPTPEHLAAMRAGREEKAEARKATEAASKAVEAPSSASAPAARTVAPPPVPAPISTKLRPFPWRGKRLVWDPATNGTWHRGPDGEDGALTKGEWFGILAKDKKSMDTEASAPDA